MPSVAAVDVGSSAIRLAVAIVSPTGALSGSDYHRYGLRLGTDVFTHGAIADSTARQLVDVFGDIAAKLREHEVTRYRAVATSAMRDADNGHDVVRAVRDATGVHLEIISGREEARLARKALARALGSAAQSALLVDIGGGSLELETSRRGSARSLPFGTVRLTERYPLLKTPLATRALREVQRCITDDLAKRVPRPRYGLAIATGGNLDILAHFAPYGSCFWPAIDLGRLQSLTESLAQLTVTERREVMELRSDRADVIVPAALVLLALKRVYGVKVVVVPGTGLRESILHDLVSSEPIISSAKAVAKRFGVDLLKAKRRADLAKGLFEALLPVHRLWAPALRILETAAYLYDIGRLVDPEDDARHAAYLVRHVTGLALDVRCRDVVGYALAVASDAPLFESTSELRPDDLSSGRILGGLLAVAHALAGTATKRQVRADLLHAPILIDAGVTQSVDPRKILLLERVLGQRVTVL
jgi:exopolyphosphatase / guanosine-5'-triphosphate,3'-diphosphate pyrophosphatase